MSTNAPAATAAVVAKPAKSKKLLVIGAVVLLLVVAGAVAAWVLTSRQSLDDQDGEHASAAKPVVVVPTFLPMDTMVVNLADPGGERFAQIGISLELVDSKTADTLKQLMPSIRSSILLLVSQRSSDELLQLEGKEQLARDILGEVSRPLGFKAPSKAALARRARAEAESDAQDGEGEDGDSPAPRRSKPDANPVRKVHFASFIIQ